MTKKQPAHISKYNNNKVLCKMTKPRSPRTILFCKDTMGFVNMIKYKTKSGDIINEPWILMKDLDYWILKYKEMGFEKITEI